LLQRHKLRGANLLGDLQADEKLSRMRNPLAYGVPRLVNDGTFVGGWNFSAALALQASKEKVPAIVPHARVKSGCLPESTHLHRKRHHHGSSMNQHFLPRAVCLCHCKQLDQEIREVGRVSVCV